MTVSPVHHKPCSADANAGDGTTAGVQQLACSRVVANDMPEKCGLVATAQPLPVRSAVCEAGRKLLTMRLQEFSGRASDAVTTAANL